MNPYGEELSKLQLLPSMRKSNYQLHVPHKRGTLNVDALIHGPTRYNISTETALHTTRDKKSQLLLVGRQLPKYPRFLDNKYLLIPPPQ